MKINKAFVDMDGVCVNFIGGLEKYLNIPILPLDDSNLGNPSLKEIIPDGHNRVEEIENAFANEDFWINLKPYSYFQEMFDFIESRFKEVYILSSPAKYPGCYSGKFTWIKEYLPKYKNKLILTNQKQVCANFDSILIDDTEDKINGFRDAGGNTLLFPQPWNYMHHVEDNFAYFKSQTDFLLS